MSQKSFRAFTLAELLIALAILGVIATFTIPKVLQSQTDSKYKSIAKETMATISGAYQAYSYKNTVTVSTKAVDLLPYLNYVNVDTVSSLDPYYGVAAVSCSTAPTLCLRLHNGALLATTTTEDFSDAAAPNATFGFTVDPDGKGDASATGTGKGLLFYLYWDGRIKTVDTCTSNCGPLGPDPAKLPPWFSWD